ncbi:hypothetical protein B4U80_05535 [Leptotrombidium deliense]|uniref:Uncharacterized protein n=1 Tax=Leptotrombidium deliense TaxID=299467 RepID=A0A443S6S6_9ACAR|nr:hypothetical protein B4U80_05535 [Leptotrombidium deliense]
MTIVPYHYKHESGKQSDMRKTVEESATAATKESRGSFRKQRATERMDKILKIILALARVDGYDEFGRIRSNDIYLDNSDIVALINNVISPRKVLVGEQEFINLLIEANVRLNSVLPKREQPLIVSEQKAPMQTRNVNKRSFDEENDDEPLRKKTLSNWTIPYDSDDDI